MSRINEQGVVNAIRDLYIALGTTPPEDILTTFLSLLNTEETQQVMDTIRQEMTNQYLAIGNQIKECLDAAAQHNPASQGATAQTS